MADRTPFDDLVEGNLFAEAEGALGRVAIRRRSDQAKLLTFLHERYIVLIGGFNTIVEFNEAMTKRREV